MLKLIPEGGNFTDIPRDHPLYVKGMISHVYRRINRNEPSKTIIAAGGGGTWGYHYPEPRPLTNRERARLQSFPDDFIQCQSHDLCHSHSRSRCQCQSHDHGHILPRYPLPEPPPSPRPAP